MPAEREQMSRLKVRPFTMADMSTVVGIAQRNFGGHSYGLFPDAVVNAYLQANSSDALIASLAKSGTEAYIVADNAGETSGFFMLRYHGGQVSRGGYGEFDLRRTQVDPDKRGQGVAGTIINAVIDRGRELGAKTISTQLGGVARGYFEQRGWRGRTELNGMTPVPAVVFACTRDIEEGPTEVYQGPDALIIASTSPRKVSLLQQAVGGGIPVVSAESTESKGHDVVEVALDKARSVEKSVSAARNITIVATDVRTDIMVVEDGQIVFANRGKSQTPEDAMNNFAAMSEVAKLTGKPVPYVVRRGTALIDPGTDHAPLTSESDISVWLNPDALNYLSTPAGFEQYRQSVLDVYGRNVMDNAASFAMQQFVADGMVAGMNGFLFDQIPNREHFLRVSDSIVFGTPDQELLRRRLGL